MRRPSPTHTVRRRGLERLADSLRRSRNVVRLSRRKLLRHRIVVAALLAAGIMTFSVEVWPFARAHMQAVAILKILGGQPVPWLVGKTLAVPITSEDIDFPVAADRGATQIVRAREYLPTSKPHAPALIVLHGVHHLGIDEPRLKTFAAAIANCGIRVLTPELPDIKDYHVDASSIRVIGESAQWFAHQTGSPVGVVGLSFSGGLTLLAAADPAYRPALKFVFAVGSQDSMGRVAEYYRTGHDPRPNGSTEVLQPHEYGPLVLEYEYLEDFVPARDIAAIRTVLRAHLYEDRAAEIASIAALNQEQRTEADALMKIDSDKTQALIEASNKKHSLELAGLSPAGRLRSLTVPVYLLHGEADNIIPSAETLWMATELPPSALKAVLVSSVLSHIDFESSQPTLLDEWRLIHFFALVMQAAETKS